MINILLFVLNQVPVQDIQEALKSLSAQNPLIYLMLVAIGVLYYTQIKFIIDDRKKYIKIIQDNTNALNNVLEYVKSKNDERMEKILEAIRSK